MRRVWNSTWLLALAASSVGALADGTTGGGALFGQPSAIRAAKLAIEADPTLLYAPGLVLVKFTDDVDAGMRERLLQPIGGRVLRTFEIVPGLYHISVDVPTDHAVAVLSAMPGVEYAEFDWVCKPSVIPNDSSFGSLWGMNNTGQVIGGSTGIVDADIDAPEGWNTYTGDQNFAIAVIDTGTLYTHPDLNDNIWTNPGEVAGNGIDDDGNGYIDDTRGWDFYSDDNNPTDSEGHGTHTAGTIGAEGNNSTGVTGVAWRCRIVPLRFLGPGGGVTSDAVLAVNYCRTKGIKVSNNSWGGGGFSSSLQSAITNAQSAGHIFVCASGNSGQNIDSSPSYPSSYNSANIISVAATTNRDGMAGFSNYGASTVDLGAPGVSVYSTVTGNGYAFYDGTSMACPHVAGVTAMVYMQNPGWTWSQVRTRVLSTVRPISALNGRCVTGGVVNLAAALTPATNNPPVVTINSPTNGASIVFGTTVNFSGTATDVEEGTISGSIEWYSSLNGHLGGGANISSSLLVPGVHTITAEVIDGTLQTDTDQITITITIPDSTPPAAPTAPGVKNLGLGQCRVKWTDSSSNETGFTIERQRKQGTTWIETTLIDAPANTGVYIDTPGAGTFRYRIRSYNAFGFSAWTARKTANVTN